MFFWPAGRTAIGGLAPRTGGIRVHSRLQVRARWINMREELTVYVNGKPYVLREDERPFKNMQVRAAPAPSCAPAAL